MRPAWTELNRPGSATRVWEAGQEPFARLIVGPHFEQMCRTWAERWASPTTFGGPVGRALTGIFNDASRRAQHQVDVVVFDSDDHDRVLAIGEAKWGRTLDVGDLDRLRAVRGVLTSAGTATAVTKLALFSGAGFTPALQQIATTDGDVVLVDLDRLYTGT